MLNPSHHNHHAMMLADFKKRFFISSILTIPILLLSPAVQTLFNIQFTFLGSLFVLFAFSTIVYFYGGFPFLKGIVEELKNKQPGMMTLIALSITISYAYSSLATIFKISEKTFFWELATLIDVMLLGHWIEMKATSAASKSVEKLAQLLPSQAHLVQHDGSIKDVKLQELKPNDLVLAKPGEKIPTDGVIVEGQTKVNESMLTGESKPVNKKIGDKIIGGSINSNQSITIKVTSTGKYSFISQLTRLVETAQQSKSQTQTLANKAAYFLTIVSISIGCLTLATWLLLNKQFVFALERMVTVMVITCPHALGLAIPLVISSITFLAAKNGLFIKNRIAFEKAHTIDTIIFDKTGTLTTGIFGVTDILTFKTWTKDKILSKAAGVETNSEHFIAQGIVRNAQEKSLDFSNAQNFQAFPGKGARGTINSTEIFIGNNKLLEHTNISDQEKQGITAKLQELESQGKTVIIVATKDNIEGLIALSDTIKTTAKNACNKLKQMGFEIVMLTGDNPQTAHYVSKQLGIDRFFANILPDQKSKIVKSLQQEGKIIAMVGDGINDAPALAQANIGIAIGAGTDVAIETSDIILTKNNPNDVVNIIKLSILSRKKMIQNLIWATGYNVITIPLAAGILYNFGIILHPALGALIMSISTIVVAINSKLIKF